MQQIVIGLDRATKYEYRDALNYFSRLPQNHVVLWNDGPRLKAIDKKLQKLRLAPQEMGKGRNVWYCLGYVLSELHALYPFSNLQLSIVLYPAFFKPKGSPFFIRES